MTISRFEDAYTTASKSDVHVATVLEAIRTGGRDLRRQVEEYRKQFHAALVANAGDYAKAKKATQSNKNKLPAVTFSGTFKERQNHKLVQHSGLLCADLDSLGPQLSEIRDKLKKSPHLWALFVSPSSDGLKAVFRVTADASKHPASFRAVERHVIELIGIQIDQSGKDVARLCFMLYDPEIYINEDAVEITPLPEPVKPKITPNAEINLSERQRITVEFLGDIDWQSETSGFVQCPGKRLHTTGDNDRDCKIDFGHVPTVHCFHTHCRGILDAINRELRSRIAKAEYQPRTVPMRIEADSEPVEPPLPPAPYVPPPLTLLPSQRQEYVIAAAESLTVDVSYILLPLLSSLGAAIGNACSIILKRGFIQPPIIWTGIIGRSGSRKSPALNAGCFAVMKHDRKLMQQNRVEAERYADELAAWDAQKGKGRGAKPELPRSLTCLMDDMTLEALADAIQDSPRGVLVKKDELSHWFAAFDQYHSGKGADVSRWLSLHTGVFFGLDRRTDKRRYRIHNPRVCIAGGIQPKVLARVLTEDFFERGLPARFLLANPPMRQDRWNETTIPDDLREAVLELFEELWLLPPEPHDGDKHPKLLPLDRDAKAVYVAYYNEVGAAAIEADEREEAAWCKLTGYAARLALVGQLARDPNAKILTGEVMRAACDLARWFGNEAVRIYAELAETQEQSEQRELREFIERRGGTVTVRDVITYYRPLKNQKEKAESMLNDLVKNGSGKWVQVCPEGRGRPTRKFQLLPVSASAKIGNSPMKTANCADADSPNSQKNMPSGEPDKEAETLAGDELGVARL